MKALSIRQPWAWLIVRGWKTIENREWFSTFTGPLLIHAGKTMTRDDYEACEIFCMGLDGLGPEFRLPLFGELNRGGIVGRAVMIDCVQRSDNQWFTGTYGFVLTDAKPLPFRPLKGALGFFDVPDQS